MRKDHLERSPKTYLSEIIRYIEKLEEFTEGLSREEFLENEMPYDRLSDMRTDLTHEYFTMDAELLWHTAKDVLPKLKPQFKKILDELKTNV